MMLTRTNLLHPFKMAPFVVKCNRNFFICYLRWLCSHIHLFTSRHCLYNIQTLQNFCNFRHPNLKRYHPNVRTSSLQTSTLPRYLLFPLPWSTLQRQQQHLQLMRGPLTHHPRQLPQPHQQLLAAEGLAMRPPPLNPPWLRTNSMRSSLQSALSTSAPWKET